MAAKSLFFLNHALARERAKQAIDDAPDGCKVVISDPLKSREQESKYHAMLSDVAQQWEFCGRKWDASDVKRLCLDQFRRDTIKDPELAQEWAKLDAMDMAPSIDRTGVVALGVQSSKLTRVLASAFIEWLYAFGAEVGVDWVSVERRT